MDYTKKDKMILDVIWNDYFALSKALKNSECTLKEGPYGPEWIWTLETPIGSLTVSHHRHRDLLERATELFKKTKKQRD